ncbi:beta-ketoacyl synthase N-terminal-like domain-containing protein [Actinokineospora auranticolor]|uniref:3-oxoacyl-[acyl-carrier-protein] synthase II n=1 Tax=Actinokineospora auranticolor TaxID=155976 RepID=A0A2S6GT28_9PSEU|nr:beta-ketoacyl synthase N-terminal-like domain-containing protein [Actinokineospora auranticolor]PPK68360.1 3-oxoacyl-[acyl-carrier-protein] synthase II [Actinokineospora auranticolor]
MAERARRAHRVAVTGVAARTAFGRDGAALLADGFAGTPAFAPVTRFDTAGRRTTTAATLPGDPVLADELVGAIEDAVVGTGVTTRAGVPLLLAAHADAGNAALAAEVAARTGFAGPARTYTGACVAATSALADAATLIATGRAERVVVAAGYLVEPSTFALFDAGRALSRDGRVRPFSAGRQGMLLGDGVAAVVLESASPLGIGAGGIGTVLASVAVDPGVPVDVAVRESPRAARPLAWLAGWARSGDAYHVCKPKPDGTGLARAITGALDRADVAPPEVGYVNANGTGTAFNDAAEVAALRLAGLGAVPTSSTKSVHGHALEASGLVEFVVTVLALGGGTLPVNSGYLGADPDCAIDVITGPRRAEPAYALTVNAAFGGANTALLLGAA